MERFSQPLLSNSPLSSSWDLTARLLRLRKKLRASSSFMKIFFTGPAVKECRCQLTTRCRRDSDSALLTCHTSVCLAGHGCRVGLRNHCVGEEEGEEKILLTCVLSNPPVCTDSQERARNAASRARRAADVRDIFGCRSGLGGV